MKPKTQLPDVCKQTRRPRRENAKHWIYTIANPVTMNVFYVGITAGLPHRVKQHLSGHGKTCETIREMLDHGQFPIFRIEHIADTKTEAEYLEAKTALAMTENGHQLLNAERWESIICSIEQQTGFYSLGRTNTK